MWLKSLLLFGALIGFVLAFPTNKLLNDKKPIGFEEFITNKFRANPGFTGSWITDTEFTLYNENGDLVVHNMEDTEIDRILIPKTTFVSHFAVNNKSIRVVENSKSEN